MVNNQKLASALQSAPKLKSTRKATTSTTKASNASAQTATPSAPAKVDFKSLKENPRPMAYGKPELDAAVELFGDKFIIKDNNGNVDIKASWDSFNKMKEGGLLQEKRDYTDWSDKRNWDDALKMLSDWAPSGPEILFRGSGGSKVYQRK